MGHTLLVSKCDRHPYRVVYGVRLRLCSVGWQADLLLHCRLDRPKGLPKSLILRGPRSTLGFPPPRSSSPILYSNGPSMGTQEGRPPGGQEGRGKGEGNRGWRCPSDPVELSRNESCYGRSIRGD